MTSEMVGDNRLRRAAERQGLTLSKSRRRDPRATDYGTYQLGGRALADLDAVEEALSR
jgi:hypothetical protein